MSEDKTTVVMPMEYWQKWEDIRKALEEKRVPVYHGGYREREFYTENEHIIQLEKKIAELEQENWNRVTKNTSPEPDIEKILSSVALMVAASVVSVVAGLLVGSIIL